MAAISLLLERGADITVKDNRVSYADREIHRTYMPCTYAYTDMYVNEHPIFLIKGTSFVDSVRVATCLPAPQYPIPSSSLLCVSLP